MPIAISRVLKVADVRVDIALLYTLSCFTG